MTHLTDGQLRACLDRQNTDTALELHLNACPTCAARARALAERADLIQRQLSGLGTVTPPAARGVLRLLRHRVQHEKDFKTMITKNFNRFRPVWLAAIAVTLATVLMFFTPTQQAFSAFLGLFRVQRIEVLPIDESRITALNSDSTVSGQLGHLFSDSVTILKEPAEPQVTTSAEQAGALAGFSIRQWVTSPSDPQHLVRDSAAFTLVINRGRAQAILDGSGFEHLTLDPAIDGAIIEVSIPATVTSAYGACPDLAETDPEHLSWLIMRKCLLVTQMPSPTVNTPPNVNIQELAAIGLQFTGMSADEARAFSQSVDWTTTLVVPIPRNGHRYEQVQVDGVSGHLIFRQPGEDDPAEFALLWVKDNMVYVVSGYDDPQNGLEVANNLK